MSQTEKPSARVRRQQEAKDASRRAIVEAACVMFDTYGYMQTSIEDIRLEAKVSRATFYKHFENKFEVAKAVAQQLSLTESLLKAPRSDSLEDLKDAIRTLFERMRERPVLYRAFGELAAVEPESFRFSMLMYERLIGVLAHRFPAFAEAEAQRESHPLRWVEACLMLREIERTAFDYVIYQSYDVPEELVLDALAARLHGYIKGAGSERGG